MYMCAPLFSKLVSLAELLLPVVSCEGTLFLLRTSILLSGRETRGREGVGR